MALSQKITKFVSQSLKTSNLQILPLAGDASSRRYFRVVKDNESWVLMAWEPFEDRKSFPFLNIRDHFAKHDVQVPEVIDCDPGLGVVLLEDLGDLTLERKFWENQSQELALPFYKQALDELIKIHFKVSKDPSPNCSAFQVRFDKAKLMWELNYGREHVLEKLNQLHLSAKAQAELDSAFDDMCGQLDREPKFICHRDFHSRNLMLTLGKMRVIDFQDARMGPIQYDLVSLVFDAYVNLTDPSREALVNDYLEKALPHLGKGFSRAHFEEIFAVQVIQRSFKAAGSFASFYNLRGDRRYIKYIQPTLKIVAAHAERLPEYSAFIDILASEGILDRGYEELCAP